MKTEEVGGFGLLPSSSNYKYDVKHTDMKIFNKLLFMLLAVGMFSSCIKEDMDDCPKYSVNTLSLSYKGDGTAEIFNEKIERVVMYVFDKNEELVTMRELTNDELAQRSVCLPELEPGTYRVTCFGNLIKDQVNDLYCGDCDKIYCAAPGYFKKETISSNDPLYYSSLELTVTEEDQNRELLFASSHYKVLVEVAGVPAESNLSIEVCGVLPYTNFENKAGGNPVDYKLDTEYSDGQFNALSNIMRHSDHSAVDVCVRDVNGNEIAKINLAEFLRANPEIDCSKHEVLIPIHFEFKSVGVEIGVPDWFVVPDVKPEF